MPSGKEETVTLKQHRLAIITHAVRWSNNILVEVLSNHGRVLSDEQRDCIRTATRALGDFPRK